MKTLLITKELLGMVDKGFQNPENDDQLSAAQKKVLETTRRTDVRASQ